VQSLALAVICQHLVHIDVPVYIASTSDHGEGDQEYRLVVTSLANFGHPKGTLALLCDQSFPNHDFQQSFCLLAATTASETKMGTETPRLLRRLPSPTGSYGHFSSVPGLIGFIVAIRREEEEAEELGLTTQDSPCFCMVSLLCADNWNENKELVEDALTGSFAAAVSYFDNSLITHGHPTAYFSQTKSYGTYALRRGRVVLVSMFDAEAVELNEFVKSTDGLLVDVQALL
jgi:hypothetical protein